jgi:type IV fimbrial biogenesis protein FimT
MPTILRPRPAPRRRRGFTLVELLVTVAVAGVLLALAAPMLRDFVTSRAVASQASDLVATLRYARGEAMKRTNAVSVCRMDAANAQTCSTAPGPWRYWMVFVDRDTRGVFDSGDMKLRVENTAPAAVRYLSLESTTYVSFQSTGIALWNNQVSMNGLRWEFDPVISRRSPSYPRDVRVVCLNAQGRVAIVDGNSVCSI